MDFLKTRYLRNSAWILALAVSATAAPRDLARMSGETERLSAQVGPKVVQIITQGVKVAGAGEEQPVGALIAERGCGSGFLVSADGYIVTNAHVIANATRIKIMVQPAQAGAMVEYAGSVVGVDSDNDLAVLKIDAKGMPFFDLGQRAEEARQGQLVLAYGSPMGLSQSATFGMVSAIQRQLGVDDPRTYIQTDAPINPGNSGGPLVDLTGALLGINTMILSQSGGNEGIGLAVPAEVIEHTYAGLRKAGTVARPRLGIQPRSLTPELITGLQLKTQKGVLIEDVAPYGPAATSGLLPGDVLVSLNSEAVHTIGDLYRTESGLTAGKTADLAVMRGADMRLLRITPLAPRERGVSPNVTEKENLIFRLGIYGATLTPEMASSLGGLRDGQGVLVLGLAGTGIAGESLIAPGDVVHEVNGHAVESVEKLRAALKTIDEGTAVVLQVERGGTLSYVMPGVMTTAGHQPKKTSATQTGTNAGANLVY